jgi:hypothetical protein
MFKNIINKILRKKQNTPIKDKGPMQLEGQRIISLWTAGVNYESRIVMF